MKSAFILAGFDNSNEAQTAHNDPAYDPLKQGLASKGYLPIGVDISWEGMTPSRYVEAFEDFYQENATPNEANIVIGNSFGALIAFITASVMKPNAIYLCSPTAYLKENSLDWVKPGAYDAIGRWRIDDFHRYSIAELANEINQTEIQITTTYGEKEFSMYYGPTIAGCCKLIANALTNSQVKEIPQAEHALTDPAYTQGILNLIEQ